ncbi:MAG: hypothetical protein OXM57_02420 [bacterium]|nr:hypothetical protein [bacterium]MDE0351538.1 hypothetical protein [bacterium]
MSPSTAWFATAARRHPVLAGVTVLYVAVWTAYGIATDAAGVYAYLVWMVFAVGLMAYLDGLVRFSTHVLVLLCIVGFCHMAGANLEISGSILYRQVWFGLVRYDHLVHVFGLGAAGLAVWEATRRMLAAGSGIRAAVVVILGANTVGALIEIGEYLASVTLGEVRLGAYANNMQDLIANLVGSLVAAWWVMRRTEPARPPGSPDRSRRAR